MSNLFGDNANDFVGYARVALEQGIDATGGLTYGIPQVLGDLAVGERVIVPLGRSNKKVAGFVIALTDQCDYENVKAIERRDEQGIALTPDLIDLAQWMANYYCSPLGMVFANMLPAAVKHGTGATRQTMVHITDAGRNWLQTERGGERIKLSKLQSTALEIAADRNDVHPNAPQIEWHDLRARAGAKSIAPIKQLINKELLSVTTQTTYKATAGVWDMFEQEMTTADDPPRLQLSDKQQAAVEKIVSEQSSGFAVQLLHGVTGSGKTEVYLRVIESIIERRNIRRDKVDGEARNESTKKSVTNSSASPGVIVLVPEISLTPQTALRFHQRFADVAVLHSGLTAAQRNQQWQRIARGKAHIVIGARSAIFAPLANLQLIIVDEEHDSSYKQDQLPRYHARDVAIKRAHLRGIRCVLGSATPSLESYFNAAGMGSVERQTSNVERPEHTASNPEGRSTFDAGRSTTPNPEGRSTFDVRRSTLRKSPNFSLIELPDRVAGFKLPKVDIVNMQEERKRRAKAGDKRGWHLLSMHMEQLLGATLAAGGQAMLLLNRRGYANYIACADHNCGWQKFCDYCDTTMVYHRDETLPTGGLIRCHHCGAEQLLPAACPDCGKTIVKFGLGTQRVEEEIKRIQPDAVNARMDSDTMRTGRDYHDTLERFREGKIDVLIGTQMIAKGLDFPNVRMVGVISADTSLHLPDFRSAERTFQLIAQVAGRAGRSETPGRVVVQTFNPDDPTIELASKHDYVSFARRELRIRARTGLPPIARMARIVVRDRDLGKCTKHATELAIHLRKFSDQLGENIRLRGPAACPIARVAEFHRQQIELIATPPDAAAQLQRLMTALRNAHLLRSDARTAVDVDPVALL